MFDNCEKCGLVDWCSGDCKWSNGTCVLRGKFLLLQKPIHLIKEVENSTQILEIRNQAQKKELADHFVLYALIKVIKTISVYSISLYEIHM